MKRLHLIERDRKMKRLDKSSQAYESGEWVLSEDTAKALIGGRVYFHEAQADPSYFGGLITGYKALPAEPGLPQRFVILFTSETSASGVSAGVEGWGREKKIVI